MRLGRDKGSRARRWVGIRVLVLCFCVKRGCWWSLVFAASWLPLVLSAVYNWQNVRDNFLKRKDGSFEFDVKGDDAHLIHDFIVGAYENLYDTAIIVSGDEDFAHMIKTAQKLGKKVENAYFSSSSSYALRRVCNSSLHLNKIISKILN